MVSTHCPIFTCLCACHVKTHSLFNTIAPTGQPQPTISDITATSVDLTWEPPTHPNGNISSYTVHRRAPSLASTHYDVGVSFTGNGHATFTPSNPSNFENELSLSFRTLGCCGVLFYAINAAKTDMFAVELRNGVPWFVFDAGSGPGVTRPEGDTRFDDGEWHTLVITQRGNTGTITVDSTHSGSGESLGLSTVIGYITHHVGGLPSDAALHTLNADPDSSAALSGKNFAGCLYDVTFNDVALDFSVDFTGVGSPSRGCPVDLVPGLHLPGSGYFSLAEDTVTGDNFNISFQFRTTHSDGLLFFMSANGGIRCSIELRDSALLLNLVNMEATEPCDGEWHSVTIRQEPTQLVVTVDESLSESYNLLETESEILSSRIYFGGIPSSSSDFHTALTAGINTYAPFSGCISEPSLYVNGEPASARIAESESIDFDGCVSLEGTRCVPSWYELDAGIERSLTDSNLTSFSGTKLRC